MSASQTPALTPFGSALAGALGAVVSNAVVYPLDTVKTRLQALPDDPSTSSKSTLPTNTASQRSKTSFKTLQKLPQHVIVKLKKWKILSMLIKIIKTEGPMGLFKGFTANMLNTFSQQFAYFFFHTLLRSSTIRQMQTRSNSSSTTLSTSSELLLGAAAGALAQILTIPVSVIATRQQLWSPSASSETEAKPKGNSKGLSLLETAKEIIEEDGPTGLWTGLKPGLVLTVNPAITYGVFERLKSYVLATQARDAGRLSVKESFLIGVISKAIATVVTYPYIFAKVRLQAKAAAGTGNDSHVEPGVSFADAASQPPSDNAPVISGPEGSDTATKEEGKPAPTRHRGAIPLLKAVYKEKGFGGWYQGLAAQIIKAVLCQGILFVSKDQFESLTWVLLASLSRLRSRVPRVAIAKQ